MTNILDNKDYEIEAQGLVKTYGNFDVLRGIDLYVNKGEFITLFGPNGAGKTTLIKILSTLTEPTSGKLTISGHNARKDVQRIRSIIGVISHDPYVYENLTALENIKFFADLYGLSDIDDRSISVMHQVGLETRSHDLVRTFSRGMKQRLAVARAIIHEPEILLLDEPYTGLDQHGAQLFGDMLSEIKGQNRTILMTTHSIDEGLGFSDRVGILAKGRIIYESPANQLNAKNFKDIYISHVEDN